MVKNRVDHAGDAAPSAELRAINERLIIESVRQHERAETAFKTAEAALKSGELYRLLTQNFPNGMVLLFDHDLRHLLADGKGLAPLGLSKKIIEGKTIWDVFPPQTCHQIEPAYRAALAGETTVFEVVFYGEGAAKETPPVERIHQVHVLPVYDDTGTIKAGMAMAQDATERLQAEETVRWQAHHDALTGLPNRTLLRDRLEQVLAITERSGKFAALLFLDLDRFKVVNDTLGHAVGDRVLRVVAERLMDCLRAEDTVARMGGDEFIILLPSLQAPQDAVRVAQKINALFDAPVRVDAHEIPVSASVGIGLFPTDGRDAESLMRCADASMYQSKHQGSGSRFPNRLAGCETAPAK